MTFIARLFGGGGTPPTAKPAPAAPTISSGQIEAADREMQARMRRRQGVEDTMLASGLGDVGAKGGGGANVQRTTLLGGGGQ
jgi:hypothetical protein